MPLLSGFDITLADMNVLGQAAMAAFRDRPVPSGWTVITPQQLGLASRFQDGIYFTNNGASAIVLQQGNTWIVAFRGTDGRDDVLRYPELAAGTYINHFEPLLSAIAAAAPGGTHFAFTGASLGGGATNQMADIAGARFGGRFAGADFVAFASPNVSNASGILNVGFENDPVYKALAGYGDFPSSLDNLVLATAEYMAGNFDGQHPFDTYAHTAATAFAAFARLQASLFADAMSPDAVVIFDAFGGAVQDVTPGRESTGAFYVGEEIADTITGRNGADFLNGFGGNDVLNGGLGDDGLAGGAGNDLLDGGVGIDTAAFAGRRLQYTVVQNPDGTFAVTDLRPGSPDGSDVARNMELFQFEDGTYAPADLLPQGPMSVSGGAGNERIAGGNGNDNLAGAGGRDALIGNSGDDLLDGGIDNDLIVGGNGYDTLLGGTGDDYMDAGPGDDVVVGGEGADSLVGGDGNDYVDGQAGNDGLFGGSRNDSLNGGDGDDYIVGGSGNNGLFGGAGNDSLNGDDNNDYMVGGAGDDGLFGGFGDDVLNGGPGTDWMVTGVGQDVIVFEAGFGADAVVDFDARNDIINLRALGSFSFDDIMARASQSGSNTIIDFGGGNTITLVDALRSNLQPDDFGL